MLCQACQSNEATVHLTQVVEGQVKKVDLCQACSKEKGVDDPAGFSLADLLMGLSSEKKPKADSTSAPDKPQSCPSCGLSREAFDKTGRLGCVDCYQVFCDVIEGLLESMHRGNRHVGKVPLKCRQAAELKNELESLQRRLEESVEAEDYESAAKYRDQIQVLKEAEGTDADADADAEVSGREAVKR